MDFTFSKAIKIRKLTNVAVAGGSIRLKECKGSVDLNDSGTE